MKFVYHKTNSPKKILWHHALAGAFRVSDWTGYPMQKPCSAWVCMGNRGKRDPL